MILQSLKSEMLLLTYIFGQSRIKKSVINIKKMTVCCDTELDVEYSTSRIRIAIIAAAPVATVASISITCIFAILKMFSANLTLVRQNCFSVSKIFSIVTSRKNDIGRMRLSLLLIPITITILSNPYYADSLILSQLYFLS